MDEKRLTNPEYVAEIIKVLNDDKLTTEQLSLIICNYHASDIADALESLDKEKRKKIFNAVSDEQLSDIFAYLDLDNVDKYVKELDIKQAANILSEMDSDDAVDIADIPLFHADQVIEFFVVFSGHLACPVVAAWNSFFS